MVMLFLLSVEQKCVDSVDSGVFKCVRWKDRAPIFPLHFTVLNLLHFARPVERSEFPVIARKRGNNEKSARRDVLEGHFTFLGALLCGV